MDNLNKVDERIRQKLLREGRKAMKHRNVEHDNWETPKYILDDIQREFGNFFDPCPLNYKENSETRRICRDYETTDGLAISWKSVNFINPPYSRKLKEAFIMKAYAESKEGKTCVLLLPVSTSTKIFHDVIHPNAEIRFIRRRIKFIGYNTKGELVTNKCGQHDSMLVIFRPSIILDAKLEQCPFCGGKAYLKEKTSSCCYEIS